MSEIIRDGPDSFEAELTCHICHTVFVVTTDDLYRGEFKEDPHTYWFDGSARAIKKYYVHCPHKCDILIIPDDTIPELAKRKARCEDFTINKP